MSAFDSAPFDAIAFDAAAGVEDVTGAADPVVLFVASAEGYLGSLVDGTGNPSLNIVAAGVGKTNAPPVGTGAATITFSALGSADYYAAAPLFISALAIGSRGVSGQASAQLTVTAAAAGGAGQSGEANSQVSFAAAASGAHGIGGAAESCISIVGAAEGWFIPPVHGEAISQLALSVAAVGHIAAQPDSTYDTLFVKTASKAMYVYQ